MKRFYKIFKATSSNNFHKPEIMSQMLRKNINNKKTPKNIHCTPLNSEAVLVLSYCCAKIEVPVKNKSLNKCDCFDCGPSQLPRGGNVTALGVDNFRNCIFHHSFIMYKRRHAAVPQIFVVHNHAPQPVQCKAGDLN